MTPYKGIIRIECRAEGACPKGVRENVMASCMDCPEAAALVLDLEGKTVHEHRVKRKKKRKAKRSPAAKAAGGRRKK